MRHAYALPETAGGGFVRYEIDEAGFRGAALDGERTHPRVAVYGDSLVFGDTSPRDETFAARLGVHLEAARGRPVEVVNAGVTGYGPDQSLLRLEAELPALAPDVVVFVLCAHNDHGDLIRNRLFRLGPQGVLERGAPRPSAELTEFFAEWQRQAARPALLRLLDTWREGPARGAERRALDAAPPPWFDLYLQAAEAEYQSAVLRGDPVVSSFFEDVYDADVALLPSSTSAEHARRLLRAVLARLRGACAAVGVPLFAVVVPSAVDLDPDFAIRPDPNHFVAWRPDNLTAACAAALVAVDVPHLDLFPVFAANEPAQLFVGGTDFHWNRRGQDLAARRTAGALARAGLLPQR